MNYGELHSLISIISILIGVGVTWGYFKTKLSDLDARCGERQASCQKRLCSKIDSLIESSNNLSSKLQSFMLEMREWKGGVNQRLNDGDRRIEDLEKHLG